MSKGLFRSIEVNFWTDCKVQEQFSIQNRYMFLYLLTNPNSNLAGCYELTFRKAAFELGYSIEQTKQQFNELIQLGVIDYCESTNEVLIINWLKHNLTSSPKNITGVKNQCNEIKCEKFREYILLYLNDNSIRYSPGEQLTDDVDNDVQFGEYTDYNTIQLNKWFEYVDHMVTELGSYFVSTYRSVAEKYLCRKLTANEVVHHINHNRKDSEIKNLMVFDSQHSHMIYHKLGNSCKLSYNEKTNVFTCC